MNDRIQLFPGDCLATLKTLANDSVDSIVTDPPYGLSFMGKRWDYDVPPVEVWAECLRVLKPGGHLLAFAGTRTQHRMAVRIEDAGFEIRDMIAWVYGSGFPKSRNLDGDWQGWGTALKPALEPITVARKPLVGTVAANVLAHGVGAMNIDGCRVGDSKDVPASVSRSAAGNSLSGSADGSLRRETGLESGHNPNVGRWPANLVHDGSDEVLQAFPSAPGQQGDLKETGRPRPSSGRFGDMAAPHAHPARVESDKSAARFFQQCKGDYNEVWQDLNLPPESANTAEQSSFQQRQAAVSALVLAASSALPEGLHCLGLLMAPSTSATGSELKRIADSVTQTIQSIDSRFWHESKPARLTLSLNHASDAEIQRLTDTTTITVNRWKSDGSAEPVTFSITQKNLEAGEKDCAPSMDGKRFIYCAKASKKDRDEGLDHMEAVHRVNGNKWTDQDYRVARGERPPSAESGPRKNTHPTVKPTDLMAYLCRLVTPPGGMVLDPFMGSGSTGKAAVREGFRFIGCELSPEYLAVAETRISAEYAKQFFSTWNTQK